MTHALEIFGRDAMMPTSALPLLAALTPDHHEVVIIDEAVEAFDPESLKDADIVGLTGMSVQRQRMKEIACQVKQMDRLLVVGGPWITVQEDYLADLTDVIFIGEADQTWPVFLDAWEQGSYLPRYEQAGRTDMTTLPPPRTDLLRLNRYLQGSVQISRGCPFLCEFCDIIVTFGRKPRVKTADQVIRELEAWRQAGMGAVFLVDDNIIGNRQKLIPILDRIIEWQQTHHYRVSLHTEASLNLADDDELLEKFVEANIRTVFVGVETPNPVALRESRKFQNMGSSRQGMPECEEDAEGFLLRRIHKIQGRGIKLTCGVILGFDSDTSGVFESQQRWLKQSGILHAMIGQLTAIPKTPLYERLKKEGRLDESEPSAYGTNVIPLNLGREELDKGFVELLRQTFEPDAYFDRMDDLYITRRFYDHAESVRVPNIPRGLRLKYLMISWSFTAYLFLRLWLKVDDARLRRHYLRRLVRYIGRRPYPMRLLDYVMESVCHYHFYRFSQDMADGRTRITNTY